MLRFIDTANDFYGQELELRFRVLREPLGHPREDVVFPFEDESLHLVAISDGHVVGCVLFHPEDHQTGRLFQMAVSPELQGSGLGTQLVRKLEDHLRGAGFHRITLHAREEAVGFYARLGYACFGEPFEEVGIAHSHMARDLLPAPETQP